MTAADRVGVIGVGEVGSGVVRALARADLAVVAHDVRAEQARDRLADVDGAITFAALAEVAAAPMVIAAVVPAAAVDLMTRLADDHLGQGAYLDVNSTGPAEKRRLAELAARAGYGTFTDGTIGGGGFRLPPGPVFHLAGPGAADWDRLLTRAGFRTDVLGTTADDVGQAALFKMVRSAFTKGYEALIAESLAIARRGGLLDPIVASIGDTFDHLSFRQVADLLVRGHVSHATRRLDEVRMARATLEPLGPDDQLVMLAGTEARFRLASGRVGERYGQPEPDDLDAALQILEPSETVR